MIADCNDDGYLPAGIHPAILEEIAARFGRESALRQVQVKSLHWLVDLALRAGARRIVVNGSFVTDKLEPNGVGCVLLIRSDSPRNAAAEVELLAGLPLIKMELVDPLAFQQFTERTFATDRNLVPKGIVLRPDSHPPTGELVSSPFGQIRRDSNRSAPLARGHIAQRSRDCPGLPDPGEFPRPLRSGRAHLPDGLAQVGHRVDFGLPVGGQLAPLVWRFGVGDIDVANSLDNRILD
jgi:hypothetical protein